MTYGCETWSLSNTQLEKLVTTQRKMERIMIGVTLKDRKSTEWIRKQSGLTDIIRSIRESKHRWAGHVAMRRDNRWTIRITEWIPHGNKRPRGRPRTRWCDDLIQYVGPTWSHIARDRKLWQACREGFSSLGRGKHPEWWWWWIQLWPCKDCMKSSIGDFKMRMAHHKLAVNDDKSEFL